MDALDIINYSKEENELLEFLLDMKEFYHEEDEIFTEYEELDFSSTSKRDFRIEDPLGVFDDENEYEENQFNF